MNARIAGTVYGALTLLSVVTAATAKGYVATLGEYSFLVAVSAIGVFIAYFWSHLRSLRLTAGVDRGAVAHEAGTVRRFSCRRSCCCSSPSSPT